MMHGEQRRPPFPQEKKSSLEETVVELAKCQVEMQKSQVQLVNEARTSLNNQSAQIRNLEVQIGKMARKMNERQQGTLPSSLEMNSRGDRKEHCKAIVLQRGNTMENSVQEGDNEQKREEAKNSLG